jgi:cell division septal protein FtsQ
MLPDKLSVSLKYRKPVAVIRNDRMMAVDDEGFVLPSIDTTPLSGLVFIDGIRVKRDGNNVKAVSPKNLALALGLLKAIVASKTISAQGVASIDASKITSLSFYFKNGVEIKIGCENFDRRIGLLESTLKDPRLAIDRVKYIDVRFEEVVIGPKE